MFYVYLLPRWFEMVLTQCDPCSALNAKVVQNKRGQTTGVAVTLMMVVTSALNVKVVENKRG